MLTTRTEAYTYDALDRLTAVDYGDGETQSYAFDAMGNRAEKDDTTGGTGASSATSTTDYAYDAANRLLSATAGGDEEDYESDADGNTLGDGTHTNTWDSQNRLRGCDAVDATNPNTTHHCGYTYGADGLRRSQSVIDSTQAVAMNSRPIIAPSAANVTDYAYDGTMLVREMQTVSGTLTPTATYLQGSQGPIYRRDDTQSEGTYTSGGTTYAAGKTRWYVYDGLGSVVGEVDPSGDLTSSGTFDVYGAKRSGGSTGTATTRQGFVGQCGHVTDTETGLVYMRARYYDPGTGRFVSEDPQGNGHNWFVYCDDNPVNEVDANGQNPVLIVLGATLASAAIGALWAAIGTATFQLTKTGKLDWGGIWEAALMGMIIGALAGLIGSIALLTGGATLGAAMGALGSIANLTSPLAGFFFTAVAGAAVAGIGGAIAGLISRQVEEAGLIASIDSDGAIELD